MKLPNRETVDGYQSRCLNEKKAEGETILFFFVDMS